MTSKLTLILKPDVISDAKREAAEKHISVSALVEQMFLEKKKKKQRRPELGPITRKALGSGVRRKVRLGPISRKVCGLVKLPHDKSYRELLTEALMEKYGIEK